MSYVSNRKQIILYAGFHTGFFFGGGGGGGVEREPMVNVHVGFSIGGICVRIACAKFFKTHPLCHRPRPVLVQLVEKSKRRIVVFYCNLVGL